MRYTVKLRLIIGNLCLSATDNCLVCSIIIHCTKIIHRGNVRLCEWRPLSRFPLPVPSFSFMPRLDDRLQERFCWLVAEGLSRTEAYKQTHPHVNRPKELGYSLYRRPGIKERIAEIQTEVHSRSLCALDEKRELLRQMIAGEIPTKTVMKPAGTEIHFDRLLALQIDAKLAGELEPVTERQDPGLAVTFKLYRRGDKFAPRGFLSGETIDIPGESVQVVERPSAPREQALLKVENAREVDLSKPRLDDLVPPPKRGKRK